MSKKIKYLAVSFIFLFAVLCLAASSPAAKSFAGSLQKELKPLADAMALIRSQYVEEVPENKLIEGALNGMLRSLDPYSQYLDKSAYEDLKMDTEGSFGGVGVEISIKGGHLHVIAPLDGSPAEQAGLKPGDPILKIDDVTTRDMMVSDATKKLRGEPGTIVKLTILKNSELADISIKRDWIKAKSIKQAKFLEDKIGYIKLTSFQEKSSEDFESALKNLESQGLTGLIVDLRNNAGGLLVAGVEIAEKFIPKGKLIITTKGRDNKNKVDYVSVNEHPRQIKPLILLVNKGSASSSEIMAGAIQDYGIGILVGAQTYGKGSIQSLIPLFNDGAVRITTSRYYTPSGRLIHEVGIKPDVLIGDEGEDKEEAGKDGQLSKALELAKEALAKK